MMENTICYYLCCFGCFGFCCRRKFVKTGKTIKKSKTLKIISKITPKDRKVVPMTSDPLKVKTLEMTRFHTIPNQKFKTEEQVIASYGFSLGKELGKGSFGTVYYARHKKENIDIACKVVNIPEEVDKKDKTQKRQRMKILKEIKNELFILQKSRHPHIIRLIQHFIITNNKSPKVTRLYIFQMLATNGTLHDLLSDSGPFDEKTCKIFFAQILSALSYMHSKHIAHRDLKLSNILLDESQDVLVSDFGCSRVAYREREDRVLTSNTFYGTPPYMAPELLEKKKGYDPLAVDVWAMGVILYVLFNRQYPFPFVMKDIATKQRAIRRMNQKKWRFSELKLCEPSTQLVVFLKLMLEPIPKQRPKVSQLCQNIWIRDEYQRVEQKFKKNLLTNRQIYT